MSCFCIVIRFSVLSIGLLCSRPAGGAIHFGGSTGIDYQNRAFDAGGMEYDLDYWGIFVKPTLTFNGRFSIFARLGCSRVVFDRPEFSATDYDQWGFEWGGGGGITLFRWSGLYGIVEGEISRTETSRALEEGGKEEGDLLLWNAEVRSGWDFKSFSPYAGCAYAGGNVTHRCSWPDRDSLKEYSLKDPWKFFAGAQVNLPGFINLQGRYYFGKGTMALLSFGVSF